MDASNNFILINYTNDIKINENNIIKILIYSFLSFFVVNNLHSEEIFNFEVSEIEIIEDGNIFKGYKGVKHLPKIKFL